MADPTKTPDPHAPKPAGTTKAHTIKASKSSNSWKWLAGAGAAALIVGIGYVAFNNNGTPSNDIAYNDSAATDLEANRYAGPSLDADDPVADTAASNDAPRAASASSSSAARAPARSTAASNEPVVIEQTIGVSGDGAVAQDASYAEDETVVVQGRRVLRPQWTRTPTEYRLASAYPQRALERGHEGEARVSCTVLGTGRLDCDQVSQSGFGFGSAAVRVAESFRHAETREDGQPAAGTPVNFRVVFRIADERPT